MTLGDCGLGKTSFVKTMFHLDPRTEHLVATTTPVASRCPGRPTSPASAPETFAPKGVGSSPPVDEDQISQDDTLIGNDCEHSSPASDGLEHDDDVQGETLDELESKQDAWPHISGHELKSMFSAHFAGRAYVQGPGIVISQKHLEEPVDSQAPTSAKVRVNLQIITCPDFASYPDNTNSWAPIVKYIEDQHLLYMLQEEQPDRKKLVDNRVHACVYFIRPNARGLKPLDALVMKLLHRKVNLIPVIAKADSYTSDELENVKKRVNAALEREKIQVFRPPVTANCSHKDHEHYPFAIISDKGEEPDRLGRRYPSDFASVTTPSHCDFMRLKRLLVEEHMLDLIDDTEGRYLQYRKELMKQRITAVNEEKRKVGEPEFSGDGGIATFLHVSGPQYGQKFLSGLRISHDPIIKKQRAELDLAFKKAMRYFNARFVDWDEELRQQSAEWYEAEQLLRKGYVDLFRFLWALPAESHTNCFAVVPG